MTALPLQPPRLLTAAEFAELDEASDGRYELQEGNVVMSPSPIPEHQVCQHRVQLQLDEQVPAHLQIVPTVDIDLELVRPDRPGYVRIPDLAVVTRAGLERRRREGGLLSAREVVLVVEILSLGSSRTDRVVKRDEYADAGIPHYWIIDIEDRPTLTAYHRAGEFGYAADTPASGTFTTEVPFPVRIDLAGVI